MWVGLAQPRLIEIKVRRVAAEIPLQRQIDRVVQPPNPQATFEVLRAKAPRALGLIEDPAQVTDLCLLQAGAQVRQAAPTALGELLKEPQRLTERKLVIVEFLRDRLSRLLRPAGDRGQRLDIAATKPDELASQLEIALANPIQLMQRCHSTPPSISRSR